MKLEAVIFEIGEWAEGNAKKKDLTKNSDFVW